MTFDADRVKEMENSFEFAYGAAFIFMLDQITYRMIQKGLDIEQLADKMGVEHRYIRKIFQREIELPFSALVRMAQVLDAEVLVKVQGKEVMQELIEKAIQERSEERLS